MSEKWERLYKLSRIKMWETAPPNAMYYAGNKWYTKDLFVIVDDVYYGRALVQSGYNSADHLERANKDFMKRPEVVNE